MRWQYREAGKGRWNRVYLALQSIGVRVGSDRVGLLHMNPSAIASATYCGFHVEW